MSKRTISINPQFFNISKKKKKIIPSQVNINAGNIRQLLLDKLKEHKKTRKVETEKRIVPLLQQQSFDEKCNEIEKIQDKIQEKEDIQAIQKDTEIDIDDIKKDVKKDIEKEIQKESDKPYGNLKNGLKPTYKQMYSEVNHKELEPESEKNQEVQNPIILEEKEVKKTFKLGKSGKKISILIKNNKSRKKVEDAKTERVKTHVSTIKNYLKKHNLIKYGSTAPTKLLREMYETSELCGGISNENKDVLIHNFHK
jgi:hypothetical protein